MLDRFPYEIFRQIIRSSLDAHSARFTIPDSDGLSPLPPTKMTHVCRSWRFALISDTTMWTWISLPTMTQDQVTEMLRRSGSAPLKVLLYTSAYDAAARLDISHFENTELALIFQEIHRFQSFELITYSLPAASLLKYLSQQLNQPAPLLRELFLDIYPGIVKNEDWNILQTLFSGNTPRLEHVYHRIITDLSGPLSSPLFRNLSSLHLDLLRRTFDYDSLLDLLELSRGLRVFELVIVGLCEAPVYNADRRVCLPYLDSLSVLGYNAAEVTNFLLERVAFSSNDVDYRIVGRDIRRISNFPALMKFISQRRHTSLSMSIRSPIPEIRITFSNNSGAGFGTTFAGKHGPTNDLVSFLDVFKLAHVTNLHLKGSLLKSTLLREVFNCLVNLEHLVIDHDDSTEMMHHITPMAFLKALMPPRSDVISRTHHPSPQVPNDDNSNPVNTLACPSLSTLKIIFRSCPRLTFDEKYAKTLMAYCTVRRRAGHALKHVSIILPHNVEPTEEMRSRVRKKKECPVDISTSTSKPQRPVLVTRIPNPVYVTSYQT